MNSHNLSELLKYIELLDEGNYNIEEVITSIPTIENASELKKIIKFIKQNEFITQVINKHIILTNSELNIYKYKEPKSHRPKDKQATHEQLRTEFTKSSFRLDLKSKLGSTCSNCNSKENIEYHHIVPLINGGTNKVSNIVPLCVECHSKAHDKSSFKNKNGGRPKATTLENAEPILAKYFNLEIGTKEAKMLLGISQKNNSTWSDITKQYKGKYPIGKDFRNNIDLLKAQENRIKSLKNNRA